MDPIARWQAVTVDCVDPEATARFWAAVLGWQVQEEPLPGWARLRGPDAGTPELTFQPVPEPQRDKARLHLDLTVGSVDDLDGPDGALARFTALGGRATGERHEYPEGVVVVVTDPEGHECCLVGYRG